MAIRNFCTLIQRTTLNLRLHAPSEEGLNVASYGLLASKPFQRLLMTCNCWTNFTLLPCGNTPRKFTLG